MNKTLENPLPGGLELVSASFLAAPELHVAERLFEVRVFAIFGGFGSIRTLNHLPPFLQDLYKEMTYIAYVAIRRSPER